MSDSKMGRVLVDMLVQNLDDLSRARRGEIPLEQVRTELVEALVDTGAVNLALPADLVARIGAAVDGTVRVRLADRTVRELGRAGVRIEILGRPMFCDAWVLPAGSTPLLGQIPLEGLDLVVDPRSGQVGPNPEHPDGPVLDLLRVA